VVCPGDRLKLQSEYAAGEGVYVNHDYILASVVGLAEVTEPPEESPDKRPVLSVRQVGKQSLVPGPGSIVTCKVSKINQRLAKTEILCVGSKALKTSFSGIIRVQDVRAVEIDKVVMFDCFRPGDIVRAEVISLGDARSYYLSTAKNELGVVYAKSLAGSAMVPVSWEEMECPHTHAREKRKVAKATTA